MRGKMRMGIFRIHTGALAPDPKAGRASPPCTPRYVQVRGRWWDGWCPPSGRVARLRRRRSSERACGSTSSSRVKRAGVVTRLRCRGVWALVNCVGMAKAVSGGAHGLCDWCWCWCWCWWCRDGVKGGTVGPRLLPVGPLPILRLGVCPCGLLGRLPRLLRPRRPRCRVLGR